MPGKIKWMNRYLKDEIKMYVKRVLRSLFVKLSIIIPYLLNYAYIKNEMIQIIAKPKHLFLIIFSFV